MAQSGKRLSLSDRALRLPRVRRVFRMAVIAVLALLALPYILAPLYAFGRPYSTVMIWRVLTGQRMQRIYEPLSRISPSLALSVIVAEDGRFCSHYGIDFRELRDAIADADDLED